MKERKMLIFSTTKRQFLQDLNGAKKKRGLRMQIKNKKTDIFHCTVLTIWIIQPNCAFLSFPLLMLYTKQILTFHAIHIINKYLETAELIPDAEYKQLKEELGKFNLPKTGLKQVLIKRL